MQEVFSMQLSKFPVVFTKDIIAIGCQQHSIEEWRNFSDEEIAEMHADALTWWKKWNKLIFTAIEIEMIK